MYTKINRKAKQSIGKVKYIVIQDNYEGLPNKYNYEGPPNKYNYEGPPNKYNYEGLPNK